MILFLVLILTLQEDEERSSSHLAKAEWMTSIHSRTSKYGRYVRPPPCR